MKRSFFNYCVKDKGIEWLKSDAKKIVTIQDGIYKTLFASHQFQPVADLGPFSTRSEWAESLNADEERDEGNITIIGSQCLVITSNIQLPLADGGAIVIWAFFIKQSKYSNRTVIKIVYLYIHMNQR